MDSIVDPHRGYTVTGSTYIAGDLVVIGNAGAELDVRGYVSAYDIQSNELRWRFHTVSASANGPFENPELADAAKTWDPKSFWEARRHGVGRHGLPSRA